MPTLPTTIYNAEQIRQFEQAAMAAEDISSYDLMQRAANAAYQELISTWPEAKNLTIVCGAGNNAGDGYELARIAHEAGKSVIVYYLADPASLKNAASTAYKNASNASVVITEFDNNVNLTADVLIDAILGTGLMRSVVGIWYDAIAKMNISNIPIFSIDIPSGLSADTGHVLGIAIKATKTITFIGLKLGLYIGECRDYRGEIAFSDLAITKEVFSTQAPSLTRLDLNAMQKHLLPRARDTHKGDYGHALIVGGNYGMLGAARMASEAAARVGAGLVSVATRQRHAGLVSLLRPEIMSHAVEAGKALTHLTERANVIVLGPGFGQSDWSHELFSAVIKTTIPLVIDADGLNLLAKHNKIRRDDWVLTPHPGEAARLLECDTAKIQADRMAACVKIQKQYGGVCVLKGAGTLIADQHGHVSVVDYGNPGMSSGGMGDVLSGVIGGLLAQGLDLATAAKVGATIHSVAADTAAKKGERGLLATDLLVHLRTLVNP